MAGSAVTLIGGSLNRWRILAPVFNQLNDLEPSETEKAQSIKKKLIIHPRYEGMSILIRYPIGVTLAGLVFALLGEMNTVRFIVMVAGTAMSMPITAAFFLLQSEISLSPYLGDPRLSGTVLTKDEVKTVTVFPKLFFSIISTLLPPLIILISFIILINLDLLHLEHQVIHFVFISSMMIITSGSTAYLIGKSLKKT